MVIAPLKSKAQTNDPPPSGSCYVSLFSSDPESSLDSVVQYSRRGNHIWEVTPTSAEDWDYCVFCGFFAPYGVRIVNWTDFDAGGEFGYSPDGVHFYPFDLSQDNPELAERVNAYRTNPNFWGILKIAPRLDDIPSFCSFCGMPTYDDDPVIGDPWRMTVWEFEIDPPYIDALPQDGATYTFTATIRPEKDHYGNSMARFIVFEIYSSREPGYCLNASRIQGLWTDTSPEDNDLKFVPNQQGFVIDNDVDLPVGGPYPGYGRAVTINPVLTASVQVRCLDYGAYGSIWALADLPGQEPFAVARWKGTFVEKGALIPLDQRDGLDNDGDGKPDEDLIDGQDNDKDGEIDEDAERNFIYDGWQWNNGAAMDDNDNEPQGDGTPGDGLSRYEEYRGLEVLGEANDENEAGNLQHVRLNPTQKEIFVSVGGIVGAVRHAGYFPGVNMPTTYLLDFTRLPDQVLFTVNPYSLRRIRPVYSIRVYPFITGRELPPEIRYGHCTQAIWSGQRGFDPFGLPGRGPMAVFHDYQIQQDLQQYG